MVSVRNLAQNLVTIFCLGLLLVATPALALDEENLADLFQEQRFDDVIEQAKSMTEHDADNGAAWHFMGRALLEKGKYKAAQDALGRAVELAFQPANSRFHLAVSAAYRKRTADALSALDDAVKGGFLKVDALEHPAFNDFRTARQFLDIAERQKRAAYPCLFDERYRQFDFWIGDWNVHSTDGNPQGHNVIERGKSGCTLTERWTSLNGGGGFSVNFFDPRSEKWNQVWVDSRGGNFRLTGAFQGNSMVLQGVHTAPDGSTELIRGRWTLMADGRVRQFFEQSKDAGKNWYVWFEGFYSKRTTD